MAPKLRQAPQASGWPAPCTMAVPKAFIALALALARSVPTRPCGPAFDGAALEKAVRWAIASVYLPDAPPTLITMAVTAWGNTPFRKWMSNPHIQKATLLSHTSPHLVPTHNGDRPAPKTNTTSDAEGITTGPVPDHYRKILRAHATHGFSPYLSTPTPPTPWAAAHRLSHHSLALHSPQASPLRWA
jgi:hypothetical protein